MNGKNSFLKFIILPTGSALSLTGNLGTGYVLVNEEADLSSLADGMLSDSRPLIKDWKIHYQINSDNGPSPKALLFLVVQTAGNITSAVQIALNNYLVTILGNQIDDVFGFQVIRQLSFTAPFPESADRRQIRQFTITLPQNILNLINKEVETERLQDLHLVCVGWYWGAVTDDLTMYKIHEIDYIEKARSITIR